MEIEVEYAEVRGVMNNGFLCNRWSGRTFKNANVSSPAIDRRRAIGRDSEAGFTLVEVLVALSILLIGIIGIAGLTGTAFKSSTYARALTQATNAAQDRVEALVSVPYANIQATGAERADLARTCIGPTGGTNRPVYTCNATNQLVIGVSPYTKNFTWSYTVTYIDLNGDGVADSADGLKRIDVTVDWTDSFSKVTKQATSTTLRAKE